MSSKVTYRQQYTRCGKERCRKCQDGTGHGPYWYAYWSEKGRTMSKYIGIKLPEGIEATITEGTTKPADAERENELTHTPAAQSAQAPLLRVYALGQFRIEHQSEGESRPLDSRSWHRRRARALLGCLLSTPGRRLGREQIMDILWPDLDIDVAANRLNGAVHELRQILEPDIARPATSRLLRLERDILELADNSQIWVDAEAFEQILQEAHASSDPEQTEQLLAEAESLYRGNYLLEELYAEWAAPRRDALQRAWIGLLLDLTNLRIERGAFIRAIETLDKLRNAEPTNETALQRLMLLLTHLDRRGEALKAYTRHLDVLKRDYESEPLPETSKLYKELRQGHHPAGTIFKTTAPSEKASPAHPAPPASPPPEVTFSRPALPLGRHNQSPLIGRQAELETMRQVLLAIGGTTEKASAGQRKAGKQHQHILHIPLVSSRVQQLHFLLLKGETGIGKTRLAEELSLEAYTRGWAVAWSRSYEQESAIPFRPWTELLRILLHDIPTMTALLNVAPFAEAASQLKLERISALLPEAAFPPLPIASIASTVSQSAAPIPREQERLHLWEATLGLLGALSNVHPLLLVLDDLHWADDSSIELLTYLTHHLQDQRILLVGTCRDGELTPQHKLNTLIRDLRREQAIATVAVKPLTNSQIISLLSHLPTNIVQSIQTQAAGNPFFAEELARYVGATPSDEYPLLPLTTNHTPFGNEAGEVSSSMHNLRPSPHQPLEHDIPLSPNHSLPEGIAAVLERRLNRLSTGCQALLGRAAVLGGSFELGQLLPMAGEYDEEAVVDLLEEALRAGLLTEEGTGAHFSYHFWHPLIIKHLYERLSAARRAQLHRKAAATIKAAHANAPQEKIAAAIFSHLNRGGGEPADIAYYAELAGNQAYSLAAYSEALQYYLQVLHAFPGTPLAENSTITAQIRQASPETLDHLT